MNKRSALIGTLGVVISAILLWAAYWSGYENGFVGAQRGTYATEYAAAQIVAMSLECSGPDLRSDLLRYVELQTQELQAMGDQYEKRSDLRNVISDMFEVPVILLKVASVKPNTPPVSKLVERIDRLRANPDPTRTCRH